MTERERTEKESALLKWLDTPYDGDDIVAAYGEGYDAGLAAERERLVDEFTFNLDNILCSSSGEDELRTRILEYSERLLQPKEGNDV